MGLLIPVFVWIVVYRNFSGIAICSIKAALHWKRISKFGKQKWKTLDPTTNLPGLRSVTLVLQTRDTYYLNLNLNHDWKFGPSVTGHKNVGVFFHLQTHGKHFHQSHTCMLIVELIRFENTQTLLPIDECCFIYILTCAEFR